MDNIRKLLFLTFAGIFVTSCNIFAVFGSGNIVTETRDVPDFSKIILEGQGDIEASMGEAQSLTITTDDNIVTELETYVENNHLVIKNKDWLFFSPTRGIKIRVVMVKQPESISLSGSGTYHWIDANPIRVARLVVRISGSGAIDLAHIGEFLDFGISGSGDAVISSTNTTLTLDISGDGSIDISGSSEDATLTISGSGQYNAYNYSTVNTTIFISGSGSAYVLASGLLDCTISGSGSVYYRGSPTITLSGSGSGTVNPG